MRMLLKPIVWLVLWLVLCLTVQAQQCPQDYVSDPPLIIVSLDGFNVEYRERGLTPTIQSLIDEGASVPFMRPSYPTMTFPNHYSIVTGLYPESHGIIANSFYDDTYGSFSISGGQTTEGQWWGGDPIWNTVQRQGKISATYFWPGSEAPIGGMYPNYWFPYDGAVPFEDRVDQVLEWITMPVETRPIITTLYFNEPDSTGHDFGPDSEEVNIQLAYVDSMLDRLVVGLTNVGLLDCVNIIVLADHGMAGGGPDWIITLETYIPTIYDDAYVYGGGFTRIDPKNKSDEVRYDMMSALACQRSDLRQYEKNGLPSRFHFTESPRIEDIVLDMDPGRRGTISSTYYLLGNHGYDNYYASMNALFLGRGPAFKVNYEGESFQNIELYNLLCYLTKVTPSRNNGTLGSLNELLVNPIPITELPQEPHPAVPQYPDVIELPNRLPLSQCSGDLPAPEPWLEELNFDEGEQLVLEQTHLPWGTPRTGNLSADIVLLHQTDYVVGYSQRMRMPLWTSFTTSQTYAQATEGCIWSSDVRLDDTNTATCPDYSTIPANAFTNNVLSPLFPQQFYSDPTLNNQVPCVISNAVPSTEQQQGRWSELMEVLVPQWLAQGDLNIIVGPVFDNIADSLVDELPDYGSLPVLPSDWFALITRCQTGGSVNSCQANDLDSRAFIYPTIQAVTNCLEMEYYALEFSSTVRDVSKITGFTFYPSLTTEERIKLEIAIHSTLW